MARFCGATSQLLLPLLLCALFGGISFVQGACSRSVADPSELGPGRSAAAADSANYAAIRQADNNGVRLYSTVTATNDLLSSSLLLPPSSLRACANVIVGGEYAPYFGKSVSVAGDLVAVGAPNRLDDSSNGALYSSIDVLSLSALATRHAAGDSPSAAYAAAGVVVASITDSSTGLLGALTSMDEDATTLVSSYDSTQLVAFSPLLNRASPSFDASALANDTFIPLPNDFALDSFVLQNGVLAVTGLATDLSTGVCTPWLYSYVFVPASRGWVTGASKPLLRSSAAAASAQINGIQCQSVPSGSLPIDLSVDGKRAVVGSPRQGCAYAADLVFTSGNLQTLTVRARCADPNVVGSRFGQSVSFTTPASGDSFVVGAEYTVTAFSFAEFAATAAGSVDPLDPASSTNFWQFPNRLQPGASSALMAGASTGSSYAHAPSASASLRRIQAVASRGNLTIVVQQPLDNGLSALSASPELVALLPASAVPAGQQWNPVTRALELCQAGRYSTGSGNGFSGCALCGAGTYQSAQGQSSCVTCPASSYCPTGSVTAQYLTSSSFSPSFSSDTPWSEVDLAGLGVDFDELLVSKVFSVTAWPALIIFFVLTVLCIVLWIASFWADADGDEQECCSSVGNCCLHSYRLLGRYKYFVLGRPGPFPYTRRPAEMQADVVQYDSRGAEVASRGVIVSRNPNKASVTSQVRNEDGSVTTTTTEALEPHAECASHSHRSPECEGYVSLVFLLFALSTVCFTGMYLASYDPSNAESGTVQNVARSRSEHSIGLDLEPEYAQGIAALSTNAFQLSVSLIGFSAAQGCTSDLVLALSWEGCTVPAASVTAAPKSCATVYTGSATDIAWSDSTSYTCVLKLSLPSGVHLAPTSHFALTLPPAASFQALRYSFTSSAQASVPLILPKQGTGGSSANTDNTASISSASFSETLVFPDANARDQRPVSPLVRQWTLTPVAYRTQREDQWDDVYDTAWRAEVSDDASASSGATLQSQSLADFLYTEPAQAQTLQLTLRQSSSFTLRQTQRAMGGQAVLIYLIIGVVCVYHLFALAENLFHMAVNTCCRDAADRRRLRVAQTQEVGTSHSAIVPLPLRPQPPPLSPLKPGERDPGFAIAGTTGPLPPLYHHHHHPGRLPPLMASPHGHHGWNNFEPAGYGMPLQPPREPAYAFDARSRPITPGHHHGGGGASMPLTPGVGGGASFQFNPNSSLEEDRARFRAAAAQARRAEQHIDIELSTNSHPPPPRSARGAAGFEV